MTTKVREYPDIHFVDTDTNTVVNALIQSYEAFTGRTLYPADPARLFILWVADIIIQERVNIDFSARQNVPRYAEGEYLDSLAELFKDAYRLEPEKAKTTLRFTLSIPLEVATIVPAGTRVTVDGEIIFQTLQALTIPAGDLFGDVEAECQTAGEIGNGFVPGQITQLIDIFPYFGSVENVSESDGGADEESDAAFYERMRESVETFSTAGPLGAYEYYAKSASALIVDVKATSPEPGEVDVRVLLSGGQLPGEEILKEVLDILNADKVRPLTDHVTVAAPETVPYDIDFTYWTQEGGAISDDKVAENIAAAVRTFKEWQGAKMGRDVNPSYLISLLMQAGAKRVKVRSPVDTVVPDNAVAVIGETAVVNGGAENE
nr:MAG TPA: baseplate assembly protein [Caudoviricetes sp.]